MKIVGTIISGGISLAVATWYIRWIIINYRQTIADGYTKGEALALALFFLLGGLGMAIAAYLEIRRG